MLVCGKSVEYYDGSLLFVQVASVCSAHIVTRLFHEGRCLNMKHNVHSSVKYVSLVNIT